MAEDIDKFTVSVVVPCFNEEGNIEKVASSLLPILSAYPGYEIIFVNDGSRDRTLEVIKRLHAANSKIKYISLSRNFGHQNALRAGIDHASGDCVISMDADMEHPPELIPAMIEKWREGHEVVFTIREENPNLSFFKRTSARIFYRLMSSLSDLEFEHGTADFRLLDRKAVDAFREMPEGFLFVRGMVNWMGFSQFGMRYAPNKRTCGESKYSFRKMLFLAMNGITSFSTKPLHLSTLLGFFIACSSFLYASYAFFLKIFTDRAISGWTSVIISVLFIGGVQLLMLGIIGEYLGRLFIESKRRPHYIVKERSLPKD
ncbi:MAG TPA: glycosyltransferase [Deltaproteobacteria bacterium]|nr:MAG: glycosyl transferase family 2 [Deltaproteobacteria bacterium GWA2_55_82]OGQ63737.1 MAG: glycosyl transferase family 2 [Deltaproteobacteria bacterium RIFCSPLOWO2_02_FULL_55_12]OIJ73460.1 MAG: glycosyl transferase family 2 [Deltaproteobacteria bacterium GWC2_55_46]HBG47326.1 glycosyltransferase [Deltaproteobacteria bacterium]HCY10092.1 glycosyltransferase [Deltaproteobacteria bacterium]